MLCTGGGSRAGYTHVRSRTHSPGYKYTTLMSGTRVAAAQAVPHSQLHRKHLPEVLEDPGSQQKPTHIRFKSNAHQHGQACTSRRNSLTPAEKAHRRRKITKQLGLGQHRPLGDAAGIQRAGNHMDLDDDGRSAEVWDFGNAVVAGAAPTRWIAATAAAVDPGSCPAPRKI
ncbi:hypothetical protein G7046_g4303 [Stylonectria norvegica]|nr:hypothetical protein G7046_g4303 [Stylonectria norvegica]